MKQANVYVNETLAGVLSEDDNGYEFLYLADYLTSENAEAALVMPEDTEELALTLNGKKRKINREDFEEA